MDGHVAAADRAKATFRAFIAFVLCCGLMIPMNLTSQRAYADEPATQAVDEDKREAYEDWFNQNEDALLAEYSHGDVAISSDNAEGNVIDLKVGQTAVISIEPYQHVQYVGCGKAGKCPGECGEYVEDCFVKGMGCKCDRTPYLDTAAVNAKSSDEGVASVSGVAADKAISTSDEVGTTNAATVTITAKAAGTATVNVDTDDLLFWKDGSASYTVNVTDGTEQAGAAIAADQQLELRATDGAGRDVEIALEGATDEWAAKVSDVIVTPIANDGTEEQAQTLSGEQYAIEGDTLTIHRTGDDPIIWAKAGDTINGEGMTVAGRWGDTYYPNAKQFKVVVKAAGYADAEGVVSAGSLYSDTLDIKVQQGEDGEAAVKATLDAEDLQAYESYAFRNGSSQCGMAGVRTFSGWGTPVLDLLDKAGIKIESGDKITFECTDDFNKTFTYDELLGVNRYFVQGVYDNAEVKAAYKKMATEQTDEATLAFRQTAAKVALQENSVVEPMMSDDYTETVLSGTDWVDAAVVPTDENTDRDELVSLENQFRFIFGIKVEQSHTVSFNTGDGATQIASQAVACDPILSTENTTMNSKYWVKGITVEKDAYEPETAGEVQESLQKPADPTREGYTFEGWYTKDGSETGDWGEEFDFSAAVNADATAYAKWSQDSESEGVSIAADQQVQLRQSGDTGSARVSLENVTAEWAAAIEGVSVKAVNGNDAGAVTELSADQYSVDAESGRITFSRTEDAPVFSVALGENEPLEVTNRWGETITYPQSKDYEITIDAKGYEPVVGTVTFYTGGNDEFKIIEDADGSNETTDDRTVVKTYTRDEIAAMAEFHNGSSQCGMTGFRTFSGNGVPVKDLIANAGITVDETDAFEIDVTDHYGVNTHNYSSLLGGDRYFFQSIYDDQEVKDTYAELVESDDQAGATIELRKLLAEKALEDGSTVEPMIATEYAETILSSDDVADAVLPTAENTHMNQLVASENSFRFIYGIKIVQEDETVTFDNGDGTTSTQTVKSNPMSSTENTTMASSYWANSLIIYRGAGYADEVSDAADKIEKPADPVREGYTFEGWYTKDGSEDGDWGEAFDFAANNGTVDTDTTLYAKWAQASEPEPSEGIDLGLTVDMGDEGYEYVSTEMGREPAGKVDFTLCPSDAALAEYQKTHEGATVKDMLADWIDGITAVSIDGVALEGKAFDEWKGELTNAAADAGKLNYYELAASSNYAKITLPVALFDTNHSDKQTDTKTLSIASEGFAPFSGDVTYRNIGSDDFTVRVLDESGNVLYTKTLADADLKALDVQERYNTSANCGMAGLRSYSSQGVKLTDVLAAAGVNFGPGMTMKVRVNDMLPENGNGTTVEAGYNAEFAYEDLMADRYYYPAMWDNTTRYDELDGQTIYEVLASDMDAWKQGGAYADVLPQLIGASKQQVEPLIGFAWNEGVVSFGGSNPASAEGYNGYCDQENYRFLFGLKAGENGEAIDDNTTMQNVYGTFGIDIVADSSAIIGGGDPQPTPGSDPAVGDDQNGGDKLAKTGDSVNVLPVAGIAAAALVLGAVAFIVRRRFQN